MIENNSIKILDEVSTHIATLTEKLNNLDAAKVKADEAIDSAINCFDDADANKNDVRTVLKAGANDITEAKKVITEFINRLAESKQTWDKAQEEISASIAEALAKAKADMAHENAAVSADALRAEQRMSRNQ